MAKTDRKKTSRRKIPWKRTASLILLGCCIAAAIALTAIPNGWERTYALFGLTDVGDKADDAPFSFHVLNVGKADAMLLCCEGSTMLVDCGMSDDGEDIARYLQKRKIAHLDYAVCTHPDSDHIGGYGELLSRISANNFLLPPLPKEMTDNNPDSEAAMRVVKEKQILSGTVQAGDSLALGSAEISVFSPKKLMDSTNNNSLVLKVTYGETTLLLMGDAEAEAERLLLEQPELLSANVLKVGHHGSKTSTTEPFLKAVSPAYGVISVGRDRNELPRDEVLRRLETHQVKTYRTDRCGDIVFTSDGKEVAVAWENENG